MIRPALAWFAISCSLSVGCDLHTIKKSKIPALPTVPNDAANDSAGPRAWADAGDDICPSISKSTTTGAPGTLDHPGRISRDAATGRVACVSNGKNHGMATDVFDHGGTETGVYSFNVREGQWVGHYPNGVRSWQGTYQEGAADGSWTSWSEDGELTSTGLRKNGQRIGTWLFWSRPLKANGEANRFEVYGEKKLRRGLISDGKPVETHGVCAIGRAWPRCRVTIGAGGSFRYAANEERSDGGDAVSFSFGGDLGININRRHTVGVGGEIYIGDEFARTNLRVSYRYWLTNWLAAEVAAGLLFSRNDLPTEPADRGRFGRFSLSAADQLSLGIEAEQFSLGTGPDSEKTAIHLVARVGWIPALFSLTALGKSGR